MTSQCSLAKSTSGCCTQGLSVAGAGVPVVLLHSSMSSKSQWQKLVEDLASNFLVLALDLYGYGDLEMPADVEHFSLKTEADYAFSRIAEILKDESFHLIGHSYGGATALRLAHDYQSKILSLSLFEPVAFHLLDADDLLSIQARELAAEIEKICKEGKPEVAIQRFLDYWSGAGFFAQLPKEKQQDFIKNIDKVMLDFRAIFLEPLGLSQYQSIAKPCCLIGSKESPAPVQKILQLLAATLPNSQTHLVGGGHMAPVTHAHLVNPVLSEYLATLAD